MVQALSEVSNAALAEYNKDPGTKDSNDLTASAKQASNKTISGTNPDYASFWILLKLKSKTEQAKEEQQASRKSLDGFTIC